MNLGQSHKDFEAKGHLLDHVGTRLEALYIGLLMAVSDLGFIFSHIPTSGFEHCAIYFFLVLFVAFQSIYHVLQWNYFLHIFSLQHRLSVKIVQRQGHINIVHHRRITQNVNKKQSFQISHLKLNGAWHRNCKHWNFQQQSFLERGEKQWQPLQSTQVPIITMWFHGKSTH